ncbi:MAG: iron-containing alcohol dehydrogenase [Thermoleophilaceae bacterium]
MSDADFTWVDGERLVRFGEGALDDAGRLLSECGFKGYVLLTTERAAAQAPDLRKRAAALVAVPPGPVPDVAASVRGDVGRRPLVALGGGRVIDAAKAIAATDGLACAAVPTTLSGAEVTPFHRLPAGIEGYALVRPALVIAAPTLMASQAMPELAASAMNALGHAAEALYVRMTNPVARLAGLRAAALIATGLGAEPPARADLALGALLAGYAIGTTGFGLHHVICQTIVRAAGTPHAQTNAVMLPHVLRAMAGRAPSELGELALALGAERERAAKAAELVAGLAARAGPTRLSELGVEEGQFGRIAAEASGRPQLDATPDSPGEGELLELLRAAH